MAADQEDDSIENDRDFKGSGISYEDLEEFGIG